MNNWKRIAAIAVSGIFAIAISVTTVQSAAESVGTEENISGAIVVVNDFCSKVAAGELPATDALLLAGGTDTSSEEAEDDGRITQIESAYQDGEHVNLNLNYSRLGIANKLDNYLNVREKPSKKAKIIGKMTKNAGCHIYEIKKGWAKIISGGVEGYVKASYLTTDEEAEQLAAEVGRDCVEILTDALNVRALPSTTAPIYSVVDEGEEFEIKKEDVDEEFLNKIIKKEEISDESIERAGGMDYLLDHMDEFICIYVDDDYAFVSKEYVKEQFSLKRATKIKQLSGEDGASSAQIGIVSYAMQFLGNPYVWGGTSLTNGCDCSGFVMSLYAHYGYGLPHSSAAQAASTRSVSNPQPGDLFFYGSGGVSHVAMYIGGGQVIHASNHRDGIKISNAYYRHPLKIGRVF